MDKLDFSFKMKDYEFNRCTRTHIVHALNIFKGCSIF